MGALLTTAPHCTWTSDGKKWTAVVAVDCDVCNTPPGPVPSAGNYTYACDDITAQAKKKGVKGATVRVMHSGTHEVHVTSFVKPKKKPR